MHASKVTADPKAVQREIDAQHSACRPQGEERVACGVTGADVLQPVHKELDKLPLQEQIRMLFVLVFSGLSGGEAVRECDALLTRRRTELGRQQQLAGK